MAFEVMEERCDQCLFGPNKIVSDKRRTQILKECAENDLHFICHKATMLGRDVGCRGHYDSTPGKLARFSDWLGITKYVRLDGEMEA